MKHALAVLMILVLAALTTSACSKVPAGNVGVKVYLLGKSKGVDIEELPVGRYWIGWNEELYLFPTFTQNYVWTHSVLEGVPVDESITFQTAEGLSVNADVGISYHIRPDMVTKIFQKYRRGIDEITDIFLRNMVRDAFNQISSTCKVEDVYGRGKAKLLKDVEAVIRQQVDPIGITVERVYIIGNLRLPEAVTTALNSKIAATQRAEQRENEVREEEAAARKVVAKADGEAKSILAKADAQAEANRKLSASVTPQLIKYEAVRRWNGVMPKITGGAMPLIDMREMN